MVTYTEFQNMTITLTQCNGLYQNDINIIIIMCFITIVFFTVFIFLFAHKNKMYSNFIKYKKLGKEYIEWRNIEKRLN